MGNRCVSENKLTTSQRMTFFTSSTWPCCSYLFGQFSYHFRLVRSLAASILPLYISSFSYSFVAFILRKAKKQVSSASQISLQARRAIRRSGIAKKEHNASSPRAGLDRLHESKYKELYRLAKSQDEARLASSCLCFPIKQITRFLYSSTRCC